MDFYNSTRNSSSFDFSANNSLTWTGTSTVSSATRGCRLYSFIIYTIIGGLLCLFGFFGNTFTFFVFLRDSKKTSATFLFQALSIIDTLLLATVVPVYSLLPLVEHTGLYADYERFGYGLVLVYVLPCAFLAQTATIWLTVLVAVNRYIAVCLPYKAARLCTVSQAKKQLSIVLLVAVLYNIPKFVEARLDFSADDRGARAVPQCRAIVNNKLYFIIYGNFMYTLFLMALPLLCLTLLTIRLIRALAQLKEKRAQMLNLRQQQDNNITFVLIIVVIVFTVCQTPALANQILWSALDRPSRACGGFQFYFSRIRNLLVILNSAVNFFIYFIFNTRFRQILMHMVCRTMALQRLRMMRSTAVDQFAEAESVAKTTTL